MKTKFILTVFSVCIFCAKAITQNCSAAIAGDTCTGKIIQAVTSGGKVTQLEWSSAIGTITMRTKKEAFLADATTVAGGNGFGYTPDKFNMPKSICVDEQGNIYVSDYNNHFVTRWAPGAATGVIVAGGNGGGSNTNQLFYPRGIVLDDKGSLYIADAGNGRIVKWKPGAQAGIVLAENITYLKDIYVDTRGNIYALHDETVERWDAETHTLTIVAGGNGSGSNLNQFFNANAVCADKEGNVYVADLYNSRIMKWAPGATSGTVANGIGGAGNYADKLLSPYDVDIDNRGNLYVADLGNNRVQLLKPGEQYGITLAGGYGRGALARQLYYAQSICRDKEGNIYVLDSYLLHVQKFETSDTINTEYLPEEAIYHKVTATFENGCIAESPYRLIKSTPHITGINGPSYNICVPDTISYNAYAPPASSYTWYTPQGLTIISGQGTPVINVAIDGFHGGEISLAASNGCGTSLQGMQLHRFPYKPNPIIGPYSVKAGEKNISFSVKKPSEHVTYTWEVPAGVTLVSGQGTPDVTVNWGNAAGYLYIYSKNDCGEFHAPRIRYVGVIPTTAADKTIADGKPAAENKLQLYPNPVQSLLSITFQSNDASQKTITVFNVHGKKVITKQVMQTQLQLDVSKLSAGIYYIQVEDANAKKSYSGKFIKQ